MADLRTNLPGGVMTVHGLILLEDSSPGMRVRVHEDGVGQDWSGWTVDYAQIATADLRTSLVSLSVDLQADGWVQIDVNLAQMTPGLAPSDIYPKGRQAAMTVRLKDPSTWPVYLIAPSTITIQNGPGANT